MSGKCYRKWSQGIIKLEKIDILKSFCLEMIGENFSKENFKPENMKHLH